MEELPLPQSTVGSNGPRSAPAAEGAALDTAAAELVLPGSPRDFLARLVPGDPLGVHALAAATLRRRSLFLDPERVALRTLARVAYRLSEHAADVLEGAEVELESIDTVVEVALDAAIRDLRREERARWLSQPRAKKGAEETWNVPDAVRSLARPLGLDPVELVRGCAGFAASVSRPAISCGSPRSWQGTGPTGRSRRLYLTADGTR